MKEKLLIVRKRPVWVAKKAQASRSAIRGPMVGRNRNWRMRMSGELGRAVSIKIIIPKRKDGIGQ
jgi:hypothetical protein